MKKLYIFIYFIASVSIAQSVTIDNNFNPLDDGAFRQYIGNASVSVPNDQLLSIYYNRQSNTTKIIRLNSNGSIDPTFSFNENISNDCSLRAKADGKFIVLSRNIDEISNKYGIKSFNADGTLNPDFTSPLFTINNQYDDTAISDFIYQDDGKIMIVGFFKEVNGASFINIVRLNNNGSIDSTFNSSGGGFYFSYGNSPRCVTQQPDGKYLVGGSFTMYKDVVRRKLIRLLTNGDIDTGLISFSNGSGILGDVSLIVVQPDGKFITNGGFSLSSGTVSQDLNRFYNYGTRDTSFINNYSSNLNETKRLIVLSDGKLLISRTTKIERRNANNSTDNTFVDNNTVGNTSITSIFLHNQKILVNGNYRSTNGVTRYGIHKLNMNGSLDNSFNPPSGTNLMFEYNLYGYNNSIGGPSYLNVLNNGSILVQADASTSYNDTPVNMLFKLTESGLLDTSFNLDPSIQITNFLDNQSKIRFQNNGKIVICAATIDINSSYYSNISVNGVAKSMIRLNQDGSLDTTFNFNFIANNSILDYAIQSDNKIIITGTGGFFMTNTKYKLVRLNSNGTIDTSYTSQLFFFPVKKIEMQNNDRPIIAANTISLGTTGASDFRLYGLTVTGAIETTFTSTGGLDFNYINVLSNDKIIVRSGSTIYRINASGTLDTSFSQINSNGAIAIDDQNKIYSKETFTLKIYSQNGILEESVPIQTPNPNVQIVLHGCDKILLSSCFNEISGLKKNNIVQYNLSNSSNTPNAPTGNNSQSFTSGQTLADLIVVGQNILWYSNQNSCLGNNGRSTSNVTLPPTTLLVSGTTYYASQSIDDIESHFRLPITVNQNLGLEENTFENIKIFPNPIIDFLQIQNQYSITKVELYNVLGQVVSTHIADIDNLSIDFSNLNSGIYILKIYSKTTSKSVKIIKE